MIKPKAPIVAQLEITDNCNHRCVHCYNFWRDEEYNSRRISEDDVLRLKRISHTLVEGEIFYVTLTGGEPLLMKEPDLESIIQIYKENNVDIGLNSNITLAREEHCEIFQKNGITILTSIPSSDEAEYEKITQVPGSFQKFVKNAQMLSSSGIRVSANMVVDKTRLDKIYQTGKFIASLGCKGFAATRLSPSNNGRISVYEDLLLDNKDIEYMLDQLLALKKDFGLSIASLNALPYCCVPNSEKFKELFVRSCVAGLTTVGISSQGQVRACNHFDVVYGSVLDDSLQSIWKKVPIWKEMFPRNECQGCAYEQRCGGGCRENAYNLTGDINGEDSLKTHGFGPISRKWDGKVRNIDAILVEDDLKVRDEEFGGILFKAPSKYAFVDKFTLFFIKQLYHRKHITKKDLLDIGSSIDYVTEQYVNITFSSLVNNKVARIAGGENNGAPT